MLHVGDARRRGHILVLDDKLVLQKNRKFKVVEPDASGSLTLFMRVVRLAHRLARMATAAGEKGDAFLLRPQMVPQRCEFDRRLGERVLFLDRLAATPVGVGVARRRKQSRGVAGGARDA